MSAAKADPAATVVMPRLSDSMEEGTVLNWRKRVGEEVAIGEELVEIETDKANMAYEADVAGKLTKILVREGEAVPIGAPIALIGGDPDPDLAAEETSPTDTPAGVSSTQAGHELPPPNSPGGTSSGPAPSAGVSVGEVRGATAMPKASPLARRIAAELGVDLALLTGTGPGGRIVRKDVEGARGSAPAAAPSGSPETAKGSVEHVELTRPQQVVARRMSESKATAPHFYLTAEVDMGAAVAARARLKEGSREGEVVPSFNDMVVKACAIALRKFPRVNGAYRDGRFELYSRVNVGIAVAAPDALLVPTLFDADQKGLRAIAAEARALAGKVREGRITPPELSGGTFSVSNLGMYGITGFGAIVNSPQAAILAVGAIADKPVVRDGAVVPGKVMEMTLSCDHRILYGADGAEFLAEVKWLLREPTRLAL